MSIRDKFNSFRDKVNATIDKYNTPENRAKIAAYAERMNRNFGDPGAASINDRKPGKKAAKVVRSNGPRFADPERLINLGSDWGSYGMGNWSGYGRGASKEPKVHQMKLRRKVVYEYGPEKNKSKGKRNPFEWNGPF